MLAGGYASAADVSALAASQERTNALLERVLAHAATTAVAASTTASFGPARLQIGPYEATQIEAQKQQAEQAQAHATL